MSTPTPRCRGIGSHTPQYDSLRPLAGKLVFLRTKKEVESHLELTEAYVCTVPVKAANFTLRWADPFESSGSRTISDSRKLIIT